MHSTVHTHNIELMYSSIIWPN